MPQDNSPTSENLSESQIWPLQDQFEFYKEWFYEEHERSQTITANLQVPIGIVTALAALAGIFLSSPPVNTAALGVFVVLMSAGCVCLGTAIYYLFLVLIPPRRFQDYARWPMPSVLHSFLTETESTINSSQTSRGSNHFWGTIVGRLRTDIERNANNNVQRAGYRHQAQQFMVYSVIALIFAGIPYFIDRWISPEEPHRVRIVQEVNR